MKRKVVYITAFILLFSLTGCGKKKESEGLKFPSLSSTDSEFEEGAEDRYGMLDYNINPETGKPYTREELEKLGIVGNVPNLRWHSEEQESGEGKVRIDEQATVEQDILANGNPDGGVDYFIDRPAQTVAHLDATKKAREKQEALRLEFAGREEEYAKGIKQAEKEAAEEAKVSESRKRVTSWYSELAELSAFADKVNSDSIELVEQNFPKSLPYSEVEEINEGESFKTSTLRAIQNKQAHIIEQIDKEEHYAKD